MIDLGFGSLLVELEKRLGLFLANVVAGCAAIIMFGFSIQIIAKVCEVVEALILSANPFLVALGMFIMIATFAMVIFILFMMRVHYFRNAVRQFDEDQDKKMKAFREELEELQAKHQEEGRQQLARMEAYQKKLEAYRHDS